MLATILTYGTLSVFPRKASLQNCLLFEMSWWMDELRRSGCVEICDLHRLFRKAERKRIFLERQGMHSLVAAAVKDGEKELGFVGMNHVGGPSGWDDA